MLSGLVTMLVDDAKMADSGFYPEDLLAQDYLVMVLKELEKRSDLHPPFEEFEVLKVRWIHVERQSVVDQALGL